MTMKAKKWLLGTILAIIGSGNVLAQQTDSDYHNEIGISYGFLSNFSWLGPYTNRSDAFKEIDFDNKSFIGPLSLEYFHRIKPNMAVGAVFAVGMKKEDVYLNGKENGKSGDNTNNYLTLMPAMKYEWLQKKHFTLYSKIAAGVSFDMENYKYDDSKLREHSSHSFYINFQASLLGIESSGTRIRAFAELGLGEQGLALIGMRYRF